MTDENEVTPFDFAFEYALLDEGSKFTNDPDDSGGPTKYGVTLRQYERFVGHSVLTVEIEELSIENAKIFYQERFWKPTNCQGLTKVGVSTAIFDTAILYGPKTSVTMAQWAARNLGAILMVDGILGPRCVEFLNSADENQFLNNYRDMILDRIETVIRLNQKNEKYRKGWVNRANRLLTLKTPNQTPGG